MNNKTKNNTSIIFLTLFFLIILFLSLLTYTLNQLKKAPNKPPIIPIKINKGISKKVYWLDSVIYLNYAIYSASKIELPSTICFITKRVNVANAEANITINKKFNLFLE